MIDACLSERISLICHLGSVNSVNKRTTELMFFQENSDINGERASSHWIKN